MERKKIRRQGERWRRRAVLKKRKRKKQKVRERG